MKCSFIIPVYNSEKYIKKCLNSILKQDSYNIKFEIIIIDDGSTDGTANIICDIQKKYPKIIRYYYQKNLGVSISRNKGIKKSRGKYIVFVDSDDELSDSFFKIINTTLKKENYDIIKTSVKCIERKKYDNRFDVPIFEKLNGKESLIAFCESNKIFATPWSYIFNKKLFTKNKLYFSPNKLHEDYGLIPLIISKSKTVTSLKSYGYVYIKRKDSLVTKCDFESELIRMNDFIYQTYSLIKYFNKFYLFDSKSKKIICNYFMKRLYIKIRNFEDNLKKGDKNEYC